MAKTVRIDLAEPLVGHKGPVEAVVLRPPNLLEYGRIGEVYSVVPGPGGEVVPVENDPAIAQYMEICVVEPEDKLLLGQVQLADAIRIREAILGFFAEARRGSQSPTSPTGSSSPTG